MSKSIIVGMGIGNLYKSVLTGLGIESVTVDLNPSKGDYESCQRAIQVHGSFHTAHVCTPNFTHESIADTIAESSRIVFVEKPGVINSAAWKSLVDRYPNTRFMMVKNNQWRGNISQLRELAFRAKTVNLNWINRDRVPNPGTWFTTKELAFGGVSRDLMPHLLSLHIALTSDYRNSTMISNMIDAQWKLEELTQTDYGTVNANGVYDVDDYCRLQYMNNGRVWNLTSQWRSMDQDRRCIEFVMPDDQIERFELGLCPEEAYSNMIAGAIANIDNDEFWADQLAQDLWIHNQIEAK